MRRSTENLIIGIGCILLSIVLIYIGQAIFKYRVKAIVREVIREEIKYENIIRNNN